MKVENGNTLDDYVASGNETTAELLGANGSFVRAMRAYHDFFPQALWAGENEISPIAMMTAMNAHLLLVAGMRNALTGHAAAIFPILRTALESACYTWLMVEKPALEEIWLYRHRSDADRDACRRAFASAVKDTAKGLRRHAGNMGDLVEGVYQSSIDFGGHPNVMSIFNHLRTKSEAKQYTVSLTALHAADSHETARSMLACLDFGQAIAITLAFAKGHPGDTMVEALDVLDALKEAAIAEYNSDGEPA